MIDSERGSRQYVAVKQCSRQSVCVCAAPRPMDGESERIGMSWCLTSWCDSDDDAAVSVRHSLMLLLHSHYTPLLSVTRQLNPTTHIHQREIERTRNTNTTPLQSLILRHGMRSDSILSYLMSS